jgi:hypothetical protein
MSKAEDIRRDIRDEITFYGSREEVKSFIEDMKDIALRATGRKWESMRLRLLDYAIWKKLSEGV